jgi:hypothetical protein
MRPHGQTGYVRTDPTRGRFGMYLPPMVEALGLAEVEHNQKNNRTRAI